MVLEKHWVSQALCLPNIMSAKHVISQIWCHLKHCQTNIVLPKYFVGPNFHLPIFLSAKLYVCPNIVSAKHYFGLIKTASQTDAVSAKYL
jgi:hypothetical protein